MTGRLPSAVRVVGIRKRFGEQTALHDVSLDFIPGGVSTLLGPSGCGKTTLLRTIAGFTEPDAGRVEIGNRDVTAVPPWRRRIGFVFQSHALWPHMTVFENVAWGLTLRGVRREEIPARVEAMLGTVGLPGAGERQPGHLSGGQQQRVALARALVLEPEVLLLDEPLSSLDARMRVEMRREIRRLQREVGITTVHVTHDQEEALELSDRIAVMSGGRVEQVGTPEEVYRRPRSAAVASFLGAANILEGDVAADGGLLVAGVALPLSLPRGLAGRRVRVAVRPENVAIGGGDGVPATVTERVYQGPAWRVTLRLADGLAVVASTGRDLEPGQLVSLTLRDAVVVDE